MKKYAEEFGLIVFVIRNKPRMLIVLNWDRTSDNS